MNRQQIKSLLLSSDTAVERAMVALYHRQTAAEQHTSSTHVTNGRGFSAFHAKKGTYYAMWVLKGKRLTSYHLDNARRIACHYVGQLAEMSEAAAYVQPLPTFNPTVVVVPTEADVLSYIIAHDPFQFRHTPARDVGALLAM